MLPAVPSTMMPPGLSALRHRVLDDGERRAVLYRTAGVHELGLAINLAAGRLRGMLQADERRVANGVEYGRAGDM